MTAESDQSVDGSGSVECEHCGYEMDGDLEPVEGEDGVYCGPSCQYDAEVLGVEPSELAPYPRGGVQ